MRMMSTRNPVEQSLDRQYCDSLQEVTKTIEPIIEAYPAIGVLVEDLGRFDSSVRRDRAAVMAARQHSQNELTKPESLATIMEFKMAVQQRSHYRNPLVQSSREGLTDWDNTKRIVPLACAIADWNEYVQRCEGADLPLSRNINA